MPNFFYFNSSCHMLGALLRAWCRQLDDDDRPTQSVTMIVRFIGYFIMSNNYCVMYVSGGINLPQILVPKIITFIVEFFLKFNIILIN